MLTVQHIHEYPKVEFHCHLDGSIRPETLQKIAASQHLPIENDVARLKQKMRAPKNCHDLVDYLSCFDFVLPYLQTASALEMTAFDVMEQVTQDGIAYIEIRFAPSLSQQHGLSITDVTLAVVKGIEAAERKYPIKGNLLISGMRQEPVAKLERNLVEASTLPHEKIVGLDLAGPEEDLYLEDLDLSLQAISEKSHVQLTLHAGECGCMSNIFQAVEHGATRIGHGIALKDDTVLQQKIAQLSVCIEGCPTSNVQTKAIASYQDYPFRKWLDQGVNFCINTDNRTVSNTTLTKEYTHLLTHFNMTASEFYLLNEQAITFSFANEPTKTTVLSSMKKSKKDHHINV